MWSKKKNKDYELMEELYQLYEQKMYAVAFSILHYAEQAEDVVHDSFVKLVKYLPKIDSASSTQTKRLVMQIVKTTAVDQYRKNHKEWENSAPAEEEAVFYPTDRVEDRELLRRLLEELPKEYLEIIKFRCYYGLSTRETADILHITEANVAKRLERARDMVQKKLEREEEYDEQKQSREYPAGVRTRSTGKVL